ncbi:peroxidase family protein [Phaeodactylibacter xiamenensis]|uniref:peroxidase family protein n=1 Tax=Phaeodactylibacter xiamenensis TaxID=1524460 RepID=UPI0024A8A472|nr:peroxidase family protein [Phaeodactylibacter xiamenensis]
MQRRSLQLMLLGVLVSTALFAQPLNVDLYRTYDGSFNNPNNPDWGQAHTNLLISGNQVAYENLIDEPAGPNRPNPRRVSNSLFSQGAPLFDPFELSDFIWAFGQFLDHDFGLTPDGTEPMNISVPQGDPMFDPFNTGQAIIPMVRNVFDPSTGTNTFNPRRHPNEITAFIDGSGVYGSDEFRANWLRSFEKGKLKVSSGNLPPFNTFNGEYDAPIDPNTPHMDNPVGLTEKVFVCGDPRAGENPLLLAFHALFVREHNRLCDELAQEHPDWNDEQLYQHARKLVGGLIQSIVYDEWLPAMGVQLEPYQGYDETVHPQLFNVFTAAAFRLGHTLLNSQLLRVDENGNEIPEGHMLLRDAFFNPYPVMELGLEPFFQGMGEQKMQNFDSKVVDDVRNFLFGPPGSGGLDLVAINIQRARERGVADFNTIRQNFGLNRYSFFQQINNDQEVYARLIGLYGNIDELDPWVGMLAEEPAPGSILGQTLNRVLQVQFTNLRDGDRFYYENDPVLTDAEKDWIKNTTLHDVLMKNTTIKLMQDKVFEAMSHDEICDHMTSDITGEVVTESGEAVPSVMVNVINTTGPMNLMTNDEGRFDFWGVPACDVTMIGMERDDDLTNGVSTADLIRIQQHILGVINLDSPYKQIAADVNRSGTITVLDQIYIRRVILGQANFFPNNFSWRFVDAKYEFQTDEPQGEDFPETITVEDVLSEDMALQFIAVKVADVTGDAIPNGFHSGEVGERSLTLFQMQNMKLEAGQVYDIPVTSAAIANLEGYQFGFDFDTDMLDFQGMKPGSLTNLTEDHFGIFEEEGQITNSWVKPSGFEVKSEEPLFFLTFQAKRPVQLSEALALSEQKVKAEAYSNGLQVSNLGLVFEQGAGADASGFALQQNQPNPFRESTLINFRMPEAGWARLTVTDISGKVLLVQENDYDAGEQQWQLNRTDLKGSGVLFYTVETANDRATQRMIVVD